MRTCACACACLCVQQTSWIFFSCHFLSDVRFDADTFIYVFASDTARPFYSWETHTKRSGFHPEERFLATKLSFLASLFRSFLKLFVVCQAICFRYFLTNLKSYSLSQNEDQK